MLTFLILYLSILELFCGLLLTFYGNIMKLRTSGFDIFRDHGDPRVKLLLFYWLTFNCHPNIRKRKVLEAHVFIYTNF